MARDSAPKFIEQVKASPAHTARPARSVAVSLALSLRPSQWTKNLIIFAGLIFGQRLLDPAAITLSVAAFTVFCALSGVVYLVNDVADREADRTHPLKRFRPIASGDLPVGLAIGAAVALGSAALVAAFLLRFEFGVVAAA